MNRPLSFSRIAAQGLIVALLLAPLAALLLFNVLPDSDPVWMQYTVHFWVVGFTALAAGIACVVLVVAARTLRETRLLFLALAFAAIGGIFSIHGLMTPGYITHHFYTSVPASGWISIFAGAVLAALSAVELPPRLERSVQKSGAAIFAWAVIGIATYMALSFEAEEWLNWLPTGDHRLQYAIGISSMALFGFAIRRYWQAYQFARLPSQAAIVIALVLLAEVAAIILWGAVWHISWWSYHALYAVAFAVLFVGWSMEAIRAGSLRAIADALSMRDALAQLNRGRDAHVLRLVDEIEAKDVATLGHVSRVSAHALAIGRRLGLPPTDLRSLVLAAQMHDVGKIGVPDAILLKPGPLTDDEYREVKRHAPRGHDIARRVDALRALAPIIRAHHERLDGSGYPDGLVSEEIPLLARVIGVADTWDAMVSSRPYRTAMETQAAITELRRVRGTELDARCVDALLDSLGDSKKAA